MPAARCEIGLSSAAAAASRVAASVLATSSPSQPRAF
jgi:hypothetical protein